jgi:hypothetical protein
MGEIDKKARVKASWSFVDNFTKAYNGGETYVKRILTCMGVGGVITGTAFGLKPQPVTQSPMAPQQVVVAVAPSSQPAGPPAVSQKQPETPAKGTVKGENLSVRQPLPSTPSTTVSSTASGSSIPVTRPAIPVQTAQTAAIRPQVTATYPQSVPARKPLPAKPKPVIAPAPAIKPVPPAAAIISRPVQEAVPQPVPAPVARQSTEEKIVKSSLNVMGQFMSKTQAPQTPSKVPIPGLFGGKFDSDENND